MHIHSDSVHCIGTQASREDRLPGQGKHCTDSCKAFLYQCQFHADYLAWKLKSALSLKCLHYAFIMQALMLHETPLCSVVVAQSAANNRNLTRKFIRSCCRKNRTSDRPLNNASSAIGTIVKAAGCYHCFSCTSTSTVL